jgi:hypothetical protein
MKKRARPDEWFSPGMNGEEKGAFLRLCVSQHECFIRFVLGKREWPEDGGVVLERDREEEEISQNVPRTKPNKGEKKSF